ncbi:MAG TPA: glycosyltransferase family 2 protein, partial [Haliscomenobacter sp.]|nr:glycosyltransferase family 2 protein [Haliscomenobacter sp.]
MVQLSAVVITFNEEKNIERCILSLEGVVDEIVVVDSYSSDRTEAICAQYGVTFIQHAFAGHIQQKNWAITQASSPYVLSLDADEALSEELRQSILEAKNNWNAQGYFFNRLNNYCGQWIHHSGWYPDRKLRLWDARLGQWAGANPHDRYELQAGTTTQFLKGDLLHYTSSSFKEHFDVLYKYAEIGAKEMVRQGKRSTWFNLVFNPWFKFFKMYILKQGFRDGLFGLIICAS